MAKIFGVDFSHWQANVNFEKLVANDVRFAIFKAGEIPTKSKTEFTDPQYKRNINEARKYNIISGSYYYFHPSIGASRQARHFDAVMQRDGQPDLPPVIDVEDTDNRTPVQVADVLKAMIDYMMERGYRRPIIYSRWGFLVNQVGEPFWLKDHFLWLAQYSNQLIYKPADMSNVIMWQFTDKLKLPGVGVALDGNYWLKTEQELLALVKKPVAPAVVEPVEVPPPAIEEPEPIQIPPIDAEQDPVEIIPTQDAPVPQSPEYEFPIDEPIFEEDPLPVPDTSPELTPQTPDGNPAPQTSAPSTTTQTIYWTEEGFWKFIKQIIRAIFASIKS
jgi:GH25 family lysozyme M1 (1,4-beta-N-acetylmuramidase)